MNRTIDIYTYKCSDQGLLLPAINEYTWSIVTRASLYFIGILWCFLGMAIVADMFMCGIEKITSRTRTIKIPDQEKKGAFQEVEVKVWNDTVANLTLMAFGTSAPEIMLSVIEITGGRFRAGELGPGTIVGSAAFNLLCITAICIVSIPNGQIRRIKNIQVYAVTTFFSMFAYIWLIIVLLVFSPGEVHTWEAVVTLLMFPLLIFVSYAVDKKFCLRKSNKTASEVEIGLDLAPNPESDSSDTGSADIIYIARELGKTRGLSEEDAAKLAATKIVSGQSHNSGWYRIHATRALTGGHRLLPRVNDTLKEIYQNVVERRSLDMGSRESLSYIDISEGGNRAVVEFTATSCAVLENEGKVRIGIRRYGLLSIPLTICIETIDGTAEAGSDYKPFKGKIPFAVNETLREIYIQIIDDDIWEPDEFFFVKMSLDNKNADKRIVLGKASINQITIINDDEPGTFEFAKPSFIVREGVGKAQIQVKRINGADGSVSVNWLTKDMSAKDGKDYIGGHGTLDFSHGETSKNLEIAILPREGLERDQNFHIELKTPSGGAQIGKISATVVTVVGDEEFNSMVARIANRTKQNLDVLRLDTATWAEQFRDAMNVNGGDIDNATNLDYFMHFLTFFWKILFSFIPPPSIGGGWPTFFLSLAMIGLLTAIVGDLATILGCLIGLRAPVTAITLVALGTSMPDTFASRQAAMMEKSADSSIGNINGSNAVNVFLGLGLPWLMASIYWESKNEVFEVPEGTITFSVVLYTSCSVIAVVILMMRRSLRIFGKAELGGPARAKYACAVGIFLMWILYVLLSALNSYDVISVSF